MTDPQIQLQQVNVVVPDVGSAAAFLRALGVDVPDAAPEWSEWMPHHRGVASTVEGFDADLDSAAFAREWGGLPDGWTGVVLTLRVPTRDAVDASYERALTAGATPRREPYDAFWGSRFAAVAGPGGLVVGIMSPRDDSMRSEPPDPAGFADA